MAQLPPQSVRVQQCLSGVLARPVAGVYHGHIRHGCRAARAAFLVVPNEQEVVRVLVEYSDSIFKAFLLRVLFMAVDTVDGGAEESRRHLERHTRTGARLIEQVEE